MSTKTDKVTLILAHNQDFDGEPKEAGDEVDATPLVARALIARGAAQAKAQTKSKAAAKPAAAPKTADAAEKGGK